MLRTSEAGSSHMTNNLPDTPIDVVIIGAGLTGLTAAFHLKEAGLSLHLVEQRDRPGGVIESHSEGGFIFESGPTTGIISHAAVPRLFAAFPDLMCTASPEANRRLILKSMGEAYRRRTDLPPPPLLTALWAEDTTLLDA